MGAEGWAAEPPGEGNPATHCVDAPWRARRWLDLLMALNIIAMAGYPYFSRPLKELGLFILSLSARPAATYVY